MESFVTLDAGEYAAILQKRVFTQPALKAAIPNPNKADIGSLGMSVQK
jgi:hypothetical protein